MCKVYIRGARVCVWVYGRVASVTGPSCIRRSKCTRMRAASGEVCTFQFIEKDCAVSDKSVVYATETVEWKLLAVYFIVDYILSVQR